MKRRTILRSVLAGGAVGLAGCQVTLGSGTETPTELPERPEAVVRTFFRTRNSQTMADLAHPDSPTYEYLFYGEAESNSGSVDSEPNRVKAVRTIEEGQNEVVVRIAWESGTCEESDCPTYVEKVTLKGTESGWKLWDTEKVSGYPGPPTPAKTETSSS